MTIVITADQVDSSHTPDLAGPLVAELNSDTRLRLALPADRAAGDEVQAVPARGSDALRLILGLTRTGRWSVGCGIGSIREPHASSVRESTGAAFVAARLAVDDAKQRPHRFALRMAPSGSPDESIESIIDLLLVLRARRSAEGWELYDLTESGATQAHAAEVLGITPQAASKRARVAGLQIERAAVGPIALLLDRTDDRSRIDEGRAS